MGEAHIDAMRACRKCGLEKPATIDYFSEYGPKNFLRRTCRMCRGLKSEGANRRVIRKNLTDAERREANGSGICFNDDDVKRIYNEQGGVCQYYECDISEYYEVDHFIPIRWGGGHEPENIVLACRFCNRSKGAKLPWVWRPELFT